MPARDELKKVSQAYNENFKRLLAAVPGSVEHAECLQREKELNRQDVIYRRALHIYIGNSCPLTDCRDCFHCTGYYARKKVKGRMMPATVAVKPERGTRCELKFA